MAIYEGKGVIASADYHSVRLEATTKSGKYVKITLPKAINKGNLNWEFKEKDDVVDGLVFTGVYDNTDTNATSTTEPYTIETQDGITAGASEIMLGAGRVYIDNTLVGLTRGGNTFAVEREFRNINADGDRGDVEGRIVLERSVPTLTINALTLVVSLTSLYPAIGVRTGG